MSWHDVPFQINHHRLFYAYISLLDYISFVTLPYFLFLSYAKDVCGFYVLWHLLTWFDARSLVYASMTSMSTLHIIVSPIPHAYQGPKIGVCGLVSVIKLL